MKYFKQFIMAVFACSFIACGNGEKVSPTSQKVNGPLGKFFEVVERDYKMSENELNVEFKRIADGGPKGASWSSEPTFSVELQDEDGNVLTSKRTDVVLDKEKLETIFSLGIDETASITFKFDEDKIKGASKFKVSSKWVEGDETDSKGSNIDGTYSLNGKVDKYPISMNISIEGTVVKGSYYYVKQGANNELTLSGTNNDGELDINETDADGTPTGHFKGEFSNGIFKGLFITNKGKKMPFAVAENSADISDIDYGAIESDASDYSTTSSESEDWDALLNAYEDYVDKYISYMKKAAKGDMTALAEYPSLMEKAQEFSEKLKNAQGEMSGSQLARYNKITMKMANAANKMR